MTIIQKKIGTEVVDKHENVWKCNGCEKEYTFEDLRVSRKDKEFKQKVTLGLNYLLPIEAIVGGRMSPVYDLHACSTKCLSKVLDSFKDSNGITLNITFQFSMIPFKKDRQRKILIDVVKAIREYEGKQKC